MARLSPHSLQPAHQPVRPAPRPRTRPITVSINHNGKHYLLDSLGAVLDQREPFAEVVLVDDASQDDSVDQVRRPFPDVRVVQLTLNEGAAAARVPREQSTKVPSG